jgi:hypothetical protein
VTSAVTRLNVEPQRMTLALADGRSAVLPLTPRSLADAAFRHDPPTPQELEHAIDRVEDALTATRLRWEERGTLTASDPNIRTLPGLEVEGGTLSRDDVEALFQQLTSASFGHPGACVGLPSGGESAAALVILRECMHHLGFEAVRSAAA